MHRIAVDFTENAEVPPIFAEPGAVSSGRAVDQLLRCSRSCADAAARVESGLSDAAPERVRLLLACAEACRATAHVMVLGVSQHRELCEASTRLCEACAESCDEDVRLLSFAAICRDCADACRSVLVH